MTQEEIIEMARQAEMSPPTELAYNNYWTAYQSELETFAKLVAAKEREACAKVCEDWDSDEAFVSNIAEAIRARGEA